MFLKMTTQEKRLVLGRWLRKITFLSLLSHLLIPRPVVSRVGDSIVPFSRYRN